MNKSPDKPEQTDDPNLNKLFAGGGEMGERIRSFDWTKTSLGPIDQWPQSLKTAVRIMLTSRQPFWLGWGDKLLKFYNDPYKAIVGGKHPRALGQPVSVVWREIWDEIGPMLTTAMGGVEGTYVEDQLLIMERNGYPEETYYTFSYSPIPNDQGGVGGILCANTDDTQRVIGERQLSLLRELGARTVNARAVDEACALSIDGLATNRFDLPFAMIYLLDAEAGRVTLAEKCSGIERGNALAPETSLLTDSSIWPFQEAIAANSAIHVKELSPLMAPPKGEWDRPPHQAVVIPISAQGHSGVAGVLVVGLNPYRLFEEKYIGFLELVARQISSAIANAMAYEQERKRAETLAELNRAKSTFFSNVSHEFRTPLTLMLGPLEDMLHRSEMEPASDQREQIATAHRNALRLLKLVNTLLDFSRIEGGRLQGTYEPTDLSGLTSELASVFRSMIERAEMRLIVDCPPLDQPVFIDRDMWEKIVLNLLSNAYKFTLAGEIEVSLRQRGERAELAVRDTGGGIPEEELPHLFERFHRVKGTPGRSFEGSGIGLALVKELVELHGGEIGVESQLGNGSVFRVSIPFGAAHLPADRIRVSQSNEAAVVHGKGYTEEAGRWLSTQSMQENRTPDDQEQNFQSDPGLRPNAEPRRRILLADDNADMRNYVSRLLSPHYEVIAVGDGAAAVDAAHKHPPDLVLSDIMMPVMDGFELIQELRANERLKSIPIILLSARAGEDEQLKGFEFGADDYLFKPFSARELLARVAARLELSQLRTRLDQERIASADLAAIVDSSDDAIVGKTLESVITSWNKGAEQIFGYSAEEMIGKSILTILPPDRSTEEEQVMRRIRQGEQIDHFETIRRRKDGTLIDVSLTISPIKNAHGQIIGASKIARDITTTKRTARQLEEERDALEIINQVGQMLSAELDLEKLVQALTDAGTELTGAKFGSFFYNVLNEQGASYMLYSLSGVPREHFLHFPMPRATDLFGPTFRGEGVIRIDDVKQDPRYGRNSPYFGMPEGHLQVTSYLAVPVVSRSGQVLGGTFFGHPEAGVFTERHERIVKGLAGQAAIAMDNARLYEAMKKSRTEAENANRLKDEFLATVSHELRTPLNSILGWARLLNRTHFDEAGRMRAIGIIEKSAVAQGEIIEDILDVSRIITGKLRLEVSPIDILKVVEEAIESVRPTAETKGVRLQPVLDTKSKQVRGDRRRLQQVIWNLLSNAIKFTPRGGRVHITLSRINSHVEINVSDTGQGISPEFLPHVFERFWQADSSTKRTYGGLGLGLALVRHLTELHGGSVSAHSEGEGRGATFIVQLPIAIMVDGTKPVDQPAVSPLFSLPDSGDASETNPLELEGVRVLLVDDEADARELIQVMLKQCGAEVRTAGSMQEAIELLKDWKPNVLVSDIGLPGADGYEFIQYVRSLPHREGGSIPAAALTAYARSEDRLKALIAGFQMHVSKPVEPAELTAVVASLAGKMGAARDRS